MKFLKDNEIHRDADSADDVDAPVFQLEQRLAEVDDQILELPAGGTDPTIKAGLLLEKSRLLLRLERMSDAWDTARDAFDLYLAHENWEGAVECCDVLFATDQPESLAALGMGLWLAVTFPIDPELTVAMLQHVVEETPPDSDGAAVAATVAHYIVDLRADGKQRDELMFFTNNLLGTVARRHSNVETQDQFNAWIQRLELTDPAKFLVRLRNVVDVLVQENWWFDRDAIRDRLPVN